MDFIIGEHDKLLTIQELANKLTVSVQTVYYWVSRGEIPVVKVGKHNRFIFSEVLNAFKEKTKQSESLKKPWGLL